MSIEIISINEYKTRYPDTSLNGIRDQRIQSAINLSFSYLDVKTGCAISSRWNLQDTDPQHLTTEQKEYVKEAFYVETQYILSNNMDFSQGADQTSFGSLSMSSSRPERKEVCESALMYLQKAGLYDYMSFSSPSYAGSGLSSPAGVPQLDSGNEYLTQAVGDNRYVAKSQGVDNKNKFLYVDSNGNVALKKAGLDPNSYYTRKEVNNKILPLQRFSEEVKLGYLKTITRNTITKTITIVDSHYNIITFPYGDYDGGPTGGIRDVTVNGASVVDAGGVAVINLYNYATLTDLANLIDDTQAIADKTWSSELIQEKFNALGGIVSVEVVEEIPASPVNNTMYYIHQGGTTYNIKLYANNTWTDMGTTQMDLTGLVSLNTDQTITGTKTFEKDIKIHDAGATGLGLSVDSVTNDNRTLYGYNSIKNYKNNALYDTYNLPDLNNSTGTLAITKDIEKKIISGAGAPTSATEGTVGLIYEDTTNGKAYICSEVSGSTYTWKEVSGGPEQYVESVTINQNTISFEDNHGVEITYNPTFVTLDTDQTITGIKTLHNNLVLPDWHNDGSPGPVPIVSRHWTDNLYFGNVWFYAERPDIPAPSENNTQLKFCGSYFSFEQMGDVTGSINFPKLSDSTNGKTLALAENIASTYATKTELTNGLATKENTGTCLPLTGGTMTGSIVSAGGGTPVIKGSTNNANIGVAFGGTDYEGGASLWLAGKGDGVGGFGLDTYNGTNRVSLVGRADDKKLYWNSKQVITNEPDTFSFTPNSGVTIGHFDGFAFGKMGFVEFANMNSTSSGTVQLGTIPSAYGARWNQWDAVWSSVDGTAQGLIQIAADGRVIAYAVVANKPMYVSIAYPIKG